MEWIEITKELPPRNTLVWVKRMPNRIEETPIYLAMRNGMPISDDEDASRKCHWYGIHQNKINMEKEKTDCLTFEANFSDVTVIEWSFLETVK